MRRAVAFLLLLALLPSLAGAQADRLCPDPAAAPFAGGAGDDDLTGTEAADRIAGGGGSDRVAGLGGDDCLTGDDGEDVLDGGDGADRLAGDEEGSLLGFDDRLLGGGGNDRLDGGGGNDALEGGDGNDALRGGFGDDALAGGPGDDELTGVDGADTVDGGDGHDRLSAEGGRILGGRGDDRIEGAGVAVDAGDGNDRVTLGRGDNRVRLGAGDDELAAADGVVNVVDCGPGTDVATVDRRDRLTGCERVRRRAMPDPRVVPRRGRPRTTFTLRFRSPFDWNAADDGSESLAAEVTGPRGTRCANGLHTGVLRARRGRRARVRLRPPRRGWCRGRYSVRVWYRTYEITSSCDSGDMTDEQCRGSDAPLGEAVRFRVR